MIWDSVVLGKDLTLDFNNLGPVAKYTTHLILPTATVGGIQNPVGYLLSNKLLLDLRGIQTGQK